MNLLPVTNPNIPGVSEVQPDLALTPKSDNNSETTTEEQPIESQSCEDLRKSQAEAISDYFADGASSKPRSKSMFQNESGKMSSLIDGVRTVGIDSADKSPRDYTSSPYAIPVPSRVKLDSRKANIDKFVSGYKKFHSHFFASNTSLYKTLRQSQTPKTVLIGCCDSRVDPAIITQCDPGDLFVIRNVANLVAPHKPDGLEHGVSAALEYAIQVLKVENIVVLGHSYCGGIEALMNGNSEKFPFIGPWYLFTNKRMNIVKDAKARTLKHFGTQPFTEQCRACEYASILQSLENLVSYPWIKEKLVSGDVSLTGWFFDFEKGVLMGYNPSTFKFESLVDESI